LLGRSLSLGYALKQACWFRQCMAWLQATKQEYDLMKGEGPVGGRLEKLDHYTGAACRPRPGLSKSGLL
jgi:hypothetical protein